MTSPDPKGQARFEIGRRILVVDDEQVVLDAATRILRSEGFEVGASPDAETALDMLESAIPDVAVVDLKLPGMSGLEFVETVRGDHPELPIIVTTGISSVDQAVRAIESGAFDFLPKPFTFEELLAPVKRASRYCGLRPDQRHPASGKSLTRMLFLGLLGWADPQDDGHVRIGVTDVFTNTAGESESLALPQIGDRLQQGAHAARVRTTDGRNHWVLSPLSGTVTQVNGVFESSTRSLDDDPYGDGWLAVIRPSDLEVEVIHLHEIG